MGNMGLNNQQGEICQARKVRGKLGAELLVESPTWPEAGYPPFKTRRKIFPEKFLGISGMKATARIFL